MRVEPGRPTRRRLSDAKGTPQWVCRVYPNNPLYLVSVVLVLWGIHLASDADRGSDGLTTGLLFGYITMLATAGWLVVRLGKVWEDARTVLLAVLLMFTALSASYDHLCLDDPTAGGKRLAAAFLLSSVIVELLLRDLGLRLPAWYRVPFYLQLGVLFAFPAYLGQLSIDGRDADMCLGVLGFGMAAAASLLALLPAVHRRCLYDSDNGTPWHWPYYTWSLFVFMAIAMAVRSWMLSVSFSHAKGLDAAFSPYFLAPIVVAIAVLLLEIGLLHNSKPTQRTAMAVLALVAPLSLPGDSLSQAQELSLGLLESQLVGPPLMACLAIVGIALYGAARGAAFSTPIAVAAGIAVASLDSDARSLRDLHLPDAWALATVAGWLLWRGFRRLNAPDLATGVAAALLLAGWPGEQAWLSENNGMTAVLLWAGGALTLPLFCRDPFSIGMRTAGPFCFALASPLVLLVFPPGWWDAPPWSAAAITALLTAFALVYWLRERLRWHLPMVAWCGGFTALVVSDFWLRGLADPRLQRGLTVYGLGCGALVVAFSVSLWKAGLFTRMLA